MNNKMSCGLKNITPEIKKGIIEEYRESNIFQDISRLIIFLVHVYFFTMIIDTFGFCAKIFLFLTTITFYLNACYFLLMVVNAYLHKNHNITLVQQCKINTIFRIGFTTSVVVVILYWGIYFHDPKMLGDTDMPFYFDFFLHGGNLCVMIIDKIIIDREHRYEIRICNRVLLVLTLVYFSIIYSVFLTTGFAVYPLLAKLTFSKLLILVTIGYSLFLTGNFIYKLLI
jgi:hypothetical protein